MVGKHWLQRPDTGTGERGSEFEAAWQRVLQSRGGFVDGQVLGSTWEFLCWLADEKGVLLHGSADPDIDVFEPRQPNDRSADQFSKQTALFAASDGIWPIFYAILDRSRTGMRFLNGALRFETSPGELAAMHYFFSVTAKILPEAP